ncbi:hypothetical protein CPU12_06855 [Malaciobacter molluscorum LMG 25693]|uniref:Uncharacterized protein n=1 Tax=Malaciobacter molluscorum LMG 25693 TaxID=870501 RepID=A0A2G1DI43_9BACT|nr:hypothetical protein [Malaciobacter molluscorum]AXX92372.1 hypothetical protein AMOL_1397 [Malaciobacter molluscorum LMG 25693]PHO18178.1 hypothetical protein CPU12_06855 [Malaciobacter molluscorum LMG 25693]RXJ93967.1 hypothetical protein CRV00_08800 [Malaciobacter molluscorum]
MEEKILSKEELIQLFEDRVIVDSGKGWFMNDKEVQIIALHDIDPKFLQDVTNAKYYKIIVKGN